MSFYYVNLCLFLTIIMFITNLQIFTSHTSIYMTDQTIYLVYKHSDSISQKTSSRRCLCTVLWVCVFMCTCIIKAFSNNCINAL